MRKWQRHLLDNCPPDSFKVMPESARVQSGQWRYADYKSFHYDVIECFGPVASVSLSMLYRPKVIVEMGVFSGHTSLLLCRANPDAVVHGVDINIIMPTTDLPTGYTANLHGVNNFILHIEDSQSFDMTGQVDMCFIDAEHCGDAPYNDSVRAWKNRNTSRDWCIAWDDYHPTNQDVVRAVDTFVKERDLQLHTLMSWVYVGTKPHEYIEYYLEE